MRGLSGGQKVKIVLGAATWRRPHVMCLDEPTSEFLLELFFGVTHYFSFLDYLDRESLAALIEALKVFEGGVLVITHNQDFSESLCKEGWVMRDGRLEASGHNWVEGQGSGLRIDRLLQMMQWVTRLTRQRQRTSVLLTLVRLVIVVILNCYGC